MVAQEPGSCVGVLHRIGIGVTSDGSPPSATWGELPCDKDEEGS